MDMGSPTFSRPNDVSSETGTQPMMSKYQKIMAESDD